MNSTLHGKRMNVTQYGKRCDHVKTLEGGEKEFILDYLGKHQMPSPISLQERGRWSLETHREKMMRNDAATSQGMPTALEAERDKDQSLLEALEEVRPCQLLASKTIMAVSENKYNILRFNTVMFSWLLVYGVSN